MAQLLQSPWVSGFGQIADAFVQAPLNRQRALYQQQQMANMAADNALAQKKYDDEVAQRTLENRHWDATHGIAVDNAAREAELHPGAVQKQNLDIAHAVTVNDFDKAHNPQLITQADLDIAAKEEANKQALIHNPIQNATDQAALDKARMENGDTATVIQQRPALSDSIADSLYSDVRKALPAFSVKDMLQPTPGFSQFTPTGEPIPQPEPLPLPGAPAPTMDYANGDTAAMDQASHLLDLENQTKVLADHAVMDKNLNTGTWLKDNAKSLIAADPTATVAGGTDYGDTDKGRAQAIVAGIREKQRNNIPLSPADEDNYRMAMSILSPTEVSTTMGDKGPITTTTNVDIFGDQGGIGAPQTQPPVSQGGVQTQPPVSQAGVGPRTQQVGNATVTTSGTKGPKPLTEFQQKAGFFSTTGGMAFEDMAPLLGYNLETGIYDPAQSKIAGYGNAFSNTGARYAESILGPAWQGAGEDENYKRYENAATQATEAPVRFVSGAAIQPTEYGNTRASYIPGPLDEPNVVMDKLVRYQAVLMAMDDVKNQMQVDPEHLTDEQLSQLKASGIVDPLIQKHMQELRARVKMAPQAGHAQQGQTQTQPQGQTQAQPQGTGLEHLHIDDLNALLNQPYGAQ